MADEEKERDNYEDDMNLEDEYEVPEEEEVGLDDTDFDLEGDYKPIPLAPNGTYNGVIKEVKVNKKLGGIVWKIVATANPGLTMLDGTTPIDGTEYEKINWLPKKSDAHEKTKSGKQTKRQWKINDMKEFSEGMEVNMNTPAIIRDSIENALWIGISVKFEVGIGEYKSKPRNEVERMVRADVEFDMPEDTGGEVDGEEVAF